MDGKVFITFFSASIISDLADIIKEAIKIVLAERLWAIVTTVAILVYKRAAIFAKLYQWLNRIRSQLGINGLIQYQIEDLLFEYYPIFNNWKSWVKVLKFADLKITEVDRTEFLLDKKFFPHTVVPFSNDDRVRLQDFRLKLNGHLSVSFQKVKYAEYINANEHLDELYLIPSHGTYRDVLLEQIEGGNIKHFPLTNICGAGIFSITSDSKIIISRHSLNSRVYPGLYTFTASGTLAWEDTKSLSNPFYGAGRIYLQKIGCEINEEELEMVSFGADARKLYFQFSFFERSSLTFAELKLIHRDTNRNLTSDLKRELTFIQCDLETIVKDLLDKIWEPAAEVALLIWCVKEFGRKKVFKALKKRQDTWQKRNIRNEFEYRCLSRTGYFADLTTNIPKGDIDRISEENINYVLSFIGSRNISRKTILEIGCGTGRITQRLLEHKPKSVYCIDVSPCMMKKHSNIINLYKTHVVRITDYFQNWQPVEDVKFDFILCSLVIIHNKDYKSIIKKICSLAPERVLVIEDITDPQTRQRPISQYTFLRTPEELITAFSEFNWEIANTDQKLLHNDTLTFLEFRNRSLQQ